MGNNSNYMYLNVFVDTYGKISFWSNNNGICNVDDSSSISGTFYSLDDALKIIEERFPERSGNFGIQLLPEKLYKHQGKTILLCSHSAEDIAVLCDTVHEMENGSIQRIS